MEVSQVKEQMTAMAGELRNFFNSLTPNIDIFKNGSRDIPGRLKFRNEEEFSKSNLHTYKHVGDFLHGESHVVSVTYSITDMALKLYATPYSSKEYHSPCTHYAWNTGMTSNGGTTPLLHLYAGQYLVKYMYSVDDTDGMGGQQLKSWSIVDNFYTLGSVTGKFKNDTVIRLNELIGKYHPALHVNSFKLHYSFFEHSSYIMVRGSVSFADGKRINIRPTVAVSGTLSIYIKIDKNTGEILRSTTRFGVSPYNKWSDDDAKTEYNHFGVSYSRGSCIPYTMVDLVTDRYKTDYTYGHHAYLEKNARNFTIDTILGQQLLEMYGIDCDNLDDLDLLMINSILLS